MIDFCDIRELLKSVNNQLTIKDTAYILNVHEHTIKRLIANNHLVVENGLISKNQLIQYLIKNESANLPIFDE